jgi:iron complex transport system substrate-binding protein
MKDLRRPFSSRTASSLRSRRVRIGAWLHPVGVAIVVSIALNATAGAAAAEPGKGATNAAPRPPRILSLAPNLTEIAYAAGAGSLLVGTVEFSDYPAAAKAVPRVGDAWRVDAERVLELRPDVVLVWPTGTPDTTISRLRALGLNIVEVPTQSLADVPRALRRVGRLGGTSAVAERTARDFEARVAQQRAQYAHRSTLSVFIQIDDEPIYTVNGRHVISEIVALCGGRNVFADLPQLAPPISAEAVLAADPQVILSTDDTIANPLELWNQWPRMKAVRSGNVFKLSSDLVTRASPRLAQGVEVTCSALEQARSRLAAPSQARSQNAFR